MDQRELKAIAFEVAKLSTEADLQYWQRQLESATAEIDEIRRRNDSLPSEMAASVVDSHAGQLSMQAHVEIDRLTQRLADLEKIYVEQTTELRSPEPPRLETL